MLEAIEIEIPIKSLVQMAQDVEIESSRDTLSIVISRFQDVDRFFGGLPPKGRIPQAGELAGLE